MSNEEKILSMLTNLQSDVADIKQRVIEPENGNSQPKKRKLTAQEQYDVFMAMANLLNDDEKDALGKYMEEEEARKAAIYG
ncbi:MAG: hypothetical protein IKZ53_04780 [Selenomonadaceae bacterium]|nr:hypothetical protein [Selenomonadaceae bacterium]